MKKLPRKLSLAYTNFTLSAQLNNFSNTLALHQTSNSFSLLTDCAELVRITFAQIANIYLIHTNNLR